MKSNLGILKAALGGKVGQIAKTRNRILSHSKLQALICRPKLESSEIYDLDEDTDKWKI